MSNFGITITHLCTSDTLIFHNERSIQHKQYRNVTLVASVIGLSAVILGARIPIIYYWVSAPVDMLRWCCRTTEGYRNEAMQTLRIECIELINVHVCFRILSPDCIENNPLKIESNPRKVQRPYVKTQQRSTRQNKRHPALQSIQSIAAAVHIRVEMKY